VVKSVITLAFRRDPEKMETTDLSVEAFLKGPFFAFIQELVSSRRAFIAGLLIAEGHKHPKLNVFYYDQVVSGGIETLSRLIDRGTERGELKPTRLRDYPQLLVAPVLTAICWRQLFERHHHLDTDALLALTIELLTDAIRSPGHEKQGAPPHGKGEKR
jgi:Tetracyclin repressor-like, C-terminal domain